jgi:predicted pyridoxine 5'-phosphate oxidase superfamily flavin-nucleotide-binding protein
VPTPKNVVAALSEAVQRFVREQRLGYVATVSEDGAPNVSPKGSLTVLDEHNLVFADVESPHTVRNLERDPRVEVNVVDPYARKGYRFRGRATVLHTGTGFWKVLEMYRAEGADVRRIRSIVLIEVEHVLPLVSPIYLHGDTLEEDVRGLWEEYHRSAKRRTIVDLVPPRDF